MKLQQLSVIFIIIILPIAIVLDTYVNNLIDVSNKQKIIIQFYIIPRMMLLELIKWIP